MLYLTGEYSHKLDAKNRIRIPAKMKKVLGEEYYFGFGTDNCIFVFPKETVDRKLEALVNNVKMSDLDRQRSLRAFTRTLIPAEEDNQGRVVLNPALRQYAHIEEDIMICGVGERAEIWAKKVHEEYFKDASDNYNELFKLLDI